MTLDPLPAVTLRDLVAANPASQNRTPGCHVSDVVYGDMMAVIDPAKFGPGKTPYAEANTDNWQEAGFIWEELLSAIFAARAVTRPAEAEVTRFRPGEVIRDGIIGSPDAIVYGLPGLEAPIVLEEYKCTWKSSKDFDLYSKRYIGWLKQIQSYCVMVGTWVCHLYVLHINGGYDGFIPEVKAYRLEFTAAELATHWQQMVNTARHKGRIP